MKRYDLNGKFDDSQSMREVSDGAYVKYSDVEGLIEFVKKCAMLEAKESTLNDRTEWTAERSYGNYDDCFSDGQDCSDAWTALVAREALKKAGVEC